MKIKTDEITSVIKKEIEQFSQQLEISEVGQVVEIGDGIARVVHYSILDPIGMCLCLCVCCASACV